ncbi:MAG: NADH-quinone oxidoreductase subunit N, partial [Pseudomonadota bacterium]
MEIDYSIIGTEIFLVIMAMFLLLVGAFQRPQSKISKINLISTAKKQPLHGSFVNLLSELSLVIALISIFLIQSDLLTAFGNSFIVDDYSRFAKILILLSALLCLIVSRPWQVSEKLTLFEYPILILFACIGMLIMVSANDLIVLYMGLELQSLSLYVLATIQRDNARASEAGLKYFILGAVASGLILFGSSLLYGFSGTTNFIELAHALNHLNTNLLPGITVGLVFLLCGLAFKISAVPFHMWTTDVYQGAPTSVTAFFAVAPKIAALILIVRVMTQVFGDVADLWQNIILIISIASMIFGAFAALMQ